MRKLLQTTAGWSGLVLRVVLGSVMLPHGAQKLLGWFGGLGFSGTINFFTEQMHFPAPIGWMVILIESVGSVFLLLGFLTRLNALGIGMVMVGAIATIHWRFGFFMNWWGKPQQEGFEFQLLAIGISLALVIGGGGKWSIDELIVKKTEHT